MSTENNMTITYYDTLLNKTVSIIAKDIQRKRKYDKEYIYCYLRCNGYCNVHPTYKLTIKR